MTKVLILLLFIALALFAFPYITHTDRTSIAEYQSQGIYTDFTEAYYSAPPPGSAIFSKIAENLENILIFIVAGLPLLFCFTPIGAFFLALVGLKGTAHQVHSTRDGGDWYKHGREVGLFEGLLGGMLDSEGHRLWGIKSFAITRNKWGILLRLVGIVTLTAMVIGVIIGASI